MLMHRTRRGAGGALRLHCALCPPQHGPRQAPLIRAVLKEHNLKQGGQDLREELGPLPQMLCYGLQWGWGWGWAREWGSAEVWRAAFCANLGGELWVLFNGQCMHGRWMD